MPASVFAIYKALHTSCKDFPLQFNIAQLPSEERFSNGTAASKITVAFSQHTKHYSQQSGDARMYEYDNSSLMKNIHVFHQTSIDHGYSMISGRNSGH